MRQRKQRSESQKWRDKGDDLLTAYFRGQPCAVCGTTKGVCGHHLLPKSRYACFRFCLDNLLPLCPSHHTMGTDLAAHNQSTVVVGRFIQFMQENMPSRWQWAEEHALDHSPHKINWQTEVEKLQAWIAAKKKISSGIVNMLDKPSKM